MDKKAVSPLIATVLIIGFTVALAAVVITWGSRFVQQTQEEVDITSQIGLACSKLDFEIGAIDCDSTTTPANQISKITMKSTSNQDITGFTFRARNPTVIGVETGHTNTPLTRFSVTEYIAPFTWSVTPPPADITEIEAIAHVTVGGRTEVCQAGIEKVESTTSLCGYRA